MKSAFLCSFTLSFFTLSSSFDILIFLAMISAKLCMFLPSLFLSFPVNLQVGVHNGWCYLDKPVVFHLDKQSARGTDVNKKPTASPSLRRSSMYHIRRNSTGSSRYNTIEFKLIAVHPRKKYPSVLLKLYHQPQKKTNIWTINLILTMW